jgi:outer membrane protein TolC
MPEPAPFSPESIQRIQSRGLAEQRRSSMPPLPTTLQVPPLEPRSAATAPTTRYFTERRVPLSLRQVIHRTVAYNPDVRVASFDPAINEARVIEADARFDPTLFGALQYQRQTTNNQFVGDPLNPTKLRTVQLQTGLRQVLPTGAQLEMKYQTARNDVSGSFFTNPFYQNELTLQLTQPLLQDFGVEVNRARIAIAQNDQQISRLDFRLKLEENLAKAEEAYWRLSQALREVEIQEQLLAEAQRTARTIEARKGEDVHDVQLWQAYAAVRQRQATRVQARGRVRNLSNQLKQLMGDPDLPVGGAALVVPADAPIETLIRFDTADQVETALANRAELAQQNLRIDSATVITRAAKNNRLPALNVTGSLGLVGLGGDWGEASSSQFQADFVNYAIGLSLEMPIGFRGPNAIWQRTLLQRQQGVAQYQALVEGVVLEVKQAQLEVETRWEETVSARHLRLASEKSLSALQIKLEQDRKTPELLQLVLDRQERLGEAQRAEIDAIVSYNIAVSVLERAKGTLLRYNNVVLREEADPFAPR